MPKTGATRYQKFLKFEKSKTKLKAKKDLPKGTNVTKTNFKVKKIVIKEQLKKHSTTEALSTRKLSVNELLSRLSHFNTQARTDALEGLNEVIIAHPEVLQQNLGQLINGITPLVLNVEKVVRRDSLRVLHIILGNVSIEKISPFFDIMSTYLRSAMTHIDNRIQEDSLLFLDILLECTPEKVVQDFYKIIPNFLDMISKLRVDSKPGRTLTVNLVSQITTVKWRVKVLYRLKDYLNKYVKHNSYDEQDRSADVIIKHFDTTKSNFYPLVNKNYTSVCHISCFSKKSLDNVPLDEVEKFIEYIDTLMPLLLETWLEVHPNVSGDNIETVVSEDAASLLKHILEVILQLWNLVTHLDGKSPSSNIKSIFWQKYRQLFNQHFVSSFPFVTNIRSKKSEINTFEETITDPKLVNENLEVCKLYILLNSDLNIKSQYKEVVSVLSYIEKTFSQTKSNENDDMIINILNIIFSDINNFTKTSSVIKRLFNKIVEAYFNASGNFKQKLFDILCKIALNEKLSNFHSREAYKKWLEKLPDILLEDKINAQTINIIHKFAIQNNKTFNTIVKPKLINIIENLPTITIPDAVNDANIYHKLFSLLYWINNWDGDSLNLLEKQLMDNVYKQDYGGFIFDTLKLRIGGSCQKMPKIPQYTKDALDEALKKINDNTMSLRAVAKKYNIPRATLQFKIKNPTSRSQFGPTPYLTDEEENTIEDWLVRMARKGFPRKSDDVLDTVQKFLSDNPRDTPFVNNRPGQGWLKAFLKRHPNLAQRTSEGVTKSSACVSESDIKKWFLEIRNYLTSENLLEAIRDPQRVFNADETGFQLCPSTGRVLAAKGDKNVYAVEQGNTKENVTVLFTFSADGKICPPLMVFPYKRLPEKIATSVPPEWGIGRSDTGWMTADVFNQFITEIFAPYLAENKIKKPVILFIDGHKSHITLQLSLTCTELGIELIALYPNTTRITQPADVSVFGPIKKMYRKAVRQFQAENMGEVVTKLNIATILKRVVDNLKSENIINGFRACGLCPFDENAVDYSKCLAAENTNEESNVENKLMSLKDFENIVGDEMIAKMKTLRSRGAILNDTSPTLYKVWCFFQSDLLQKESTNIEIQTANNTTTNVNQTSEINVTKVKITMTPTKTPIDLYTPSTSTDIPHVDKSINDYLQIAPENKRKFVRKTEKTPFVITSENFRAAIEKKELDKQKKEKEKIERKRKRDEQAAARKEVTLKKTRKGKGVGKKSKNGNKKENLKVETETENLNNVKEGSEKIVKTGNKNDSYKLKVLSNLVVVNCDTCRRLAMKNKSLICSTCNTYYHRQCIPIKHQEHIPDDDEVLDFICHKCFLLNDDSEPSEDENRHDDSIMS